MTPEPFLAALQVNPADDLPRLILADGVLDEGADDDLVDCVREGRPRPDAVLKRLFGPRAWLMWTRNTENPFRFRPAYGAGPANADIRGIVALILDRLCKRQMLLTLPEVDEAIRRERAIMIANRVREWWERKS